MKGGLMAKLPVSPSNCWLPLGMRRKGLSFRASQTPGKSKVETCQLISIGGLPRKAYCKGRGYKLRNYGEFCAFGDRVNGQKTVKRK